MTHLRKYGRFVLVSSIVLCLTVWIAAADAESAGQPRPWKGYVVGVGEFSEFITDEDSNVIGRLDVDTIVGQSTHLGGFTVSPESGFHTLSFVDFSFSGQAKWRAANGDELHIFYEGLSFPNTDPRTAAEFPIAAMALFVAEGGTGRFSDAYGEVLIEGAFSLPAEPDGPIDYFFDFDGGMLSY